MDQVETVSSILFPFATWFNDTCRGRTQANPALLNELPNEFVFWHIHYFKHFIQYICYPLVFGNNDLSQDKHCPVIPGISFFAEQLMNPGSSNGPLTKTLGGIFLKKNSMNNFPARHRPHLRTTRHFNLRDLFQIANQEHHSHS